VAVKIKLKRLGSKRNPQYRIVVADARNRRDGRAIEEIGLYHPKQEPSLIQVDGERARYWLGVGAQPTQAVQRLLEITGDWQQFKGLPGAEGTLKVAEAKPDRRAIFEAAAKEAAGENEKFAKEQAAKAADAAKAEQEAREAAAAAAAAEQAEAASDEAEAKADQADEAKAEAEKA
jgi:small subunit ribosomal protein S16